MPENVRTGWVAKAGDATEFARALSAALSLDDVGYRTMAARARQFAEYMIKRTKKQIRQLRGTSVLFKTDGDKIKKYYLPNA